MLSLHCLTLRYIQTGICMMSLIVSMPLLFSINIGLTIVLRRSPLIPMLPSELRDILRKCCKTEGKLKHQSPVIETSMESNTENVFLYHTVEKLLWRWLQKHGTIIKCTGTLLPKNLLLVLKIKPRCLLKRCGVVPRQ